MKIKWNQVGGRGKTRFSGLEGPAAEGISHRPGEPEGLPDYGGYRMNGKELSRYFAAAGGGLFALGYLFYKNIFVSLLFALLVLPLKTFWEQRLAERRREELSGQFRDLLYGMSASVAAGRQLPDALLEAGAQLADSYGKEAVLCREVAVMARGMRESRQQPDSLLADFARRSRIPEIRQFAQICAVCRRTGGDMEQVMEKTASLLMEKIAVKREIQMVTAQKRLEANILSAMPVALVLALNLLSPDYLSALYTGIRGRFIMTGALLGMWLSLWLSRKITEVRT